MFGLKKYLYGALSAIVAALGALAWFYKGQKEDAQKAARAAERSARANEAARKHVQETTEATREVDEDIRSKSDDAVTDSLRRYARDANKDR